MSATSRFSDLTTMAVGGPIARLRTCASAEEVVEAVAETRTVGDEWLALGGGSNIVASDEGFDGVVIAPRECGASVVDDAGDRVIVRVPAGEPWDDLVSWTLGEGWSGLEALSGIPGRAGSAPIQNIGAYGAELSDVAVGVEAVDVESGRPRLLAASACGFGYRSSVFKAEQRWIVTAVLLGLRRDAASSEVRYAQLARALGVEVGARVPAARVREAVLALRRSKGMVFDPADPDSHGCGSFFVNPIVEVSALVGIPQDAPRWPIVEEGEETDPVTVPLGDDDGSRSISPVSMPSRARVKLSAAWLIEHAGIGKGFALPGSRAAISSRHALAITNRGGATAEQVIELARFVQTRVVSQFGVVLRPEPLLVGLSL